MAFRIWWIACLIPLWAQVQIPKPDVAEMKKPIADWVKGLHGNLESAMVEQVPDLAARMGELGNLYHGMKRYETAAAFYQNAVSLDPDQALWPYYQGLLERDRTNHEAAVTYFRKVLEFEPEDVITMVRLGNVLLQLGNFQEASAVFAKAELKAPDAAMIAFGMGRAADGLGNYKMAVGYYERALKLQPQADYINYPLGMAWRRLGDRDKAVAYLSKRGENEIFFDDPRVDKLSEMVTLATLQVVLAMASDPGVTTRDFVGFVNSNLGGRLGLQEYLASAADYRASTDPYGAARLHYLVGTILLDGGERRWASGHFEASMRIKPSPEALTERGIIWALEGKLDRAIEHYDRALKLDPSDLEALFAKANALVAKGDAGAAHHCLEELLRLQPESLLNHQLMVKTQVLLGDKEAEGRYRKALLALLPPGVEAAVQHMHLAKLADAAGATAEAAAHRDTIRTLEPSDREGRLRLAGYLALEEAYDQAIELYQRILKGEPNDDAALMGQYACLIFKEDYGKAIQHLETAYQQTKSPNLAHLLARFLAAGPLEDKRDGKRALELAQEGYDAIHDLPQAEALAMAQAAAGDFKGATALQAQLIQEAAAMKLDRQILTRLRANLNRYKESQNCCDASVTPLVLLLPGV